MEGRSVEFIVEDMMNLEQVHIPSEHCDLAYCEEVLYFMMPDLRKVQVSINQMARVVKPGGWIIAIEKKIGAPTQEVKNSFLTQLTGKRDVQSVPVGDPIDIGSLFESAGLVKVKLDSTPEWSYCYRKPGNPLIQ